MQAKGFRKKYFSLAAILALNTALMAQSENISTQEKSINTQKESLEISVSRHEEYTENTDFSEIFTTDEIAKSNAQNIYEFLRTHSLLDIKPSYGNAYTQMMDLRGFGVNGHKNIAIIVDGMRLNNIDSAPISLSQIPLDAIEKIEIIKGKGTTKYGNSAVSGVLKITTKRTKNGEINIGYSSYDTLNSQFFARFIKDALNIGFYGQYQHSEGSRRITQGSDEKDGSYNKNGGVNLFYHIDKSTLLKASGNYAKYAIKYAKPLTRKQFESNPTQAGSGFLNHQKRWDLNYNLGLTHFSQNDITTDINFGGNRNESEYIGSSKMDGQGVFINFNSKFQKDSCFLEIGAESKKQERESSANAEVIENRFYLGGEKIFNNTTLYSTASFSNVKAKTNKKKVDNLVGFEIGANQKITQNLELFASFSRSFIVPNVDFMFDWQGNLNNLIDTATFDTFQIGSKADFWINTLNINGFFINGKDEAYLEPQPVGFGINKSLDKTQRIGAEIALKTQFLENLYSNIAYSYVDSKIKSGLFDGKQIPGVPNHTLVLSANYMPLENLNLGLNYKITSKAYTYDDFKNNQNKMPKYQSLNATASYTIKDFEIYAFVNNITDEKNAVAINYESGYYPYDFERTFGGGIKYKW